MEWSSFQELLGAHGKLITTVIALLIALVTLGAYAFRYWHAKLMQKEREIADVRLESATAEVEEQRRKLRADEKKFARQTIRMDQAKEELRKRREDLEARERKLDDVRNAFRGKEHDLWCIHEPRRPESYDVRLAQFQRTKPIILVANLKGGVGKSTLSANLAAYFSASGKRVLLIDADYQGSLSNMLLSADGVEEASSEINKLLETGSNAATFQSAVHNFRTKLAGCSLISSKYELASIENRLMIEHLLQEEKSRDDDGRYRLARLLLSDEVSRTFDIVLIDAPPRLTAATINGFCAATHLLVPTVYDKLSAEAVGTFLGGVKTLQRSLNHGIEFLGVVGMLTTQQGSLNPREQNAVNIVRDQATKVWGPHLYFFDRHIPRRAAVANVAGEDIAYLCDPTVKGWFDQLGADISSRIWPYTAPAEPRPTRTSRVFDRQDGASVSAPV
jgi:cellulose biosynthesis protein BcsQ